MPTPGLITLIGSGETAPSSRVLYEPAFDRLPKPVKVAIMETPAGFELNSPHVAIRVSEFIQHRLQNYKPDVTVVPARRRDYGVRHEQPGHPAPPPRRRLHLHGAGESQLHRAPSDRDLRMGHDQGASPPRRVLDVRQQRRHRHRRDGGPHLRDLQGRRGPALDTGARSARPLGLRIACVTHWNNTEGGAKLDTSRCYIGKARLETLLPALSNGTVVVGVDEHTALTLDFSEMMCRVLGKGTVTLVDDGTERVYKTGVRLPYERAGRCPHPGRF